jgi:hypothetical protein
LLVVFIQPVVDVAGRLVTGDAVTFLDLADQLVPLAVELIDFIVGQLATAL